jgi:hypothetical protein
MRWREPGKSVLQLAGISFIANLGLALSGFYNWNYDAWSHLFFASHYLHSWFNTWDPRWFGGFSVTSYPPLVTQLLALGGFVIGLGNSYILLNLIVMILLPIAMFCFSLNFLPRRQAFMAGLLVMLFPAIYLADYTYGQLPGLFAMAAALFMGAVLWRYLASGKMRDALAAALLAGITIAAHHYTFICFTPAIIAAVVLTHYFSARPTVSSLVRRLGIFALLSLPLVLLPVLPFWLYVLHAIPQTPVFHLSRANFFTNVSALYKFFLAPYLLFLLLLPLVGLSAYKHRSLIPIALVFLLFFILGLGGTTPLPHLIFGRWWQWLTYDRFALWAGILAIPLVARLIPQPAFRMQGSRLQWGASVAAAGAILAQSIGCAFFAAAPLGGYFVPSPPSVNINALVAFLDSPLVGEQYRYLTLGFGEAQMERLSTLANANDLDGSWAPGRTIPLLIGSGIGLIDTSKFSDPDLKTLNVILDSAAQFHLKWVLVNDLYYSDILTKYGFKLSYSDEQNKDSSFGSVTVWTKDDIPPIQGVATSDTGPLSIVWGIGPLLLLVGLALLMGRETWDITLMSSRSARTVKEDRNTTP